VQGYGVVQDYGFYGRLLEGGVIFTPEDTLTIQTMELDELSVRSPALDGIQSHPEFNLDIPV
jgi:hypothetical protein